MAFVDLLVLAASATTPYDPHPGCIPPVPADVPCRDNFAIVGPQALEPLLISFGATMVLFAYGLGAQYLKWRKGRASGHVDSLGKRFVQLLKNGVGQRRVVRWRYPGIMHSLIYTGFIALLIGTILASLEIDIVTKVFNTHILVGTAYLVYKLLLDIFGLALVVGLAMAIYRRAVLRPKFLRTTWHDYWMLGILLVLAVQGFTLEAVRLAVRQPAYAGWSLVGYALARVFDATGFASPPGPGSPGYDLYPAMWWTHAFTAFAFIASIPFTKFFHVLTSPAQTFYETLAPYGQLPKPFDIRAIEAGGAMPERFGVASAQDFSTRDRMMFDACVVTGRCTSVCPAYITGKVLDPMKIILDLRALVQEEARKGPLGKPIAQLVGEEELWECTTCMACMEVCPVAIRHVPPIVEMRRNLVMEQGRLPDTAAAALRNLENNFNPWGVAWDQRDRWAEGLEVPRLADLGGGIEVLYWVGCAAAYDSRNQRVARAFVSLLKEAGVRFAILGTEERCNGDPARRIGNEYLAQTLMRGNICTLGKYGVTRIVATCPHCFNILANEYPLLGGQYEVLHHTQYLEHLVKEGRLRPRRVREFTVTYHDPCYLGRYNRVYDPPRRIIDLIPGTRNVEMPRCRNNALCCGAGGGRMWMEERVGKRINIERTEEALATGAQAVATACPFCMIMFEDGIKAKGAEDRFRALDVAEMIAEAVREPGPSIPP